MRGRKDRSATCLPDLTRLQPAGGTDRERWRGRCFQAASWLATVEEPRNNNNNNSSSSSRHFGQKQNFSLISRSRKQPSAGGRPIGSSGVPNLFRPQTKPTWLELSQNDLPEGGSASLHDANSRNGSFRRLAVLTAAVADVRRLSGVPRAGLHVMQQCILVRRLHCRRGYFQHRRTTLRTFICRGSKSAKTSTSAI